MTIMIGIDPHKATHTAVAVDGNEVVLGEFKLRASRTQGPRFVAWADTLGERVWAIESANGLGYLLAQQLTTAGETVFDVRGAGVSSPGAWFGPLPEERPERRKIDRDRRVAIRASPGRHYRRPPPSAANAGQKNTETWFPSKGHYATYNGTAPIEAKVAEDKTSKEAIRALKRRISDRVHKHLIADADKTS